MRASEARTVNLVILPGIIAVHEHALASGHEPAREGQRIVAIGSNGNRREDAPVGVHLADVVSVRDLRHHHVTRCRLRGRRPDRLPGRPAGNTTHAQ
jgi:hypothetical protein